VLQQCTVLKNSTDQRFEFEGCGHGFLMTGVGTEGIPFSAAGATPCQGGRSKKGPL
jgi:hypothetical protein